MYVIIIEGRNNKVLFLVDRRYIKNRWWSTDVNDAFKFHKRSAAEIQKGKLIYKKPDVVTLGLAKKINADQFRVADIEDTFHPHDSYSLGQE